MCRNIVRLRRPDSLPTDDEVRLAALQYVRKVSGYRTPSRRNQQAFDEAVHAVATATGRLMEHLAEPVSEPSRG
jgi:hypothetical protein